jgi:hypothetical protein
MSIRGWSGRMMFAANRWRSGCVVPQSRWEDWTDMADRGERTPVALWVLARAERRPRLAAVGARSS